MTTISPLLQNKLNSQNSSKGNSNLNNRHEKIYLDLQKRAHEAKPNEAKAVLVDEGIFGNPITATKDAIKDAKNFCKAVKTGQMGDSNLGRINDLGLKVGAALIATGLALGSKTKTESIMRFIGGATFIGAMSLWPKIFINLPARLVHGFRIDRQYISAQGDKKDFFLDNQFLVWDAYPEEQLRKDAKNAGIDYDSKNGKEKIQRKMQKTALQNRALWMATAGFATPLMTAMVGNFVEPMVKEAVINGDVRKIKKKITNGHIDDVIKTAKPEVDADKAKELKATLAEAEGLTCNLLDGNKHESEAFFGKLARIIFPDDLIVKLKDSDDATTIKKYNSLGLASAIKAEYEKFAIIEKIDMEKVREAIDEIYSKSVVEEISDASEGILEGFIETQGDLLEEFETLAGTKIKGEEVKKAVEKAFESKNMSISEARKVFNDNGILNEKIEKIINDAKINNKPFYDFVQKYNEGPVAQLRARLKAYLKTVNSFSGSKDESLYTLSFRKTMKKLFKGFKLGSEKNLRELVKGENPLEFLIKQIGQTVKDMDESQYQEFLVKFLMDDVNSDGKIILKMFASDVNLAKIMPENILDGHDVEKLNSVIAGATSGSKGILAELKNFIETKGVDLESIRARAILAINLERRIAQGKIAGEDVSIARKMIYDGGYSNFVKGMRKDILEAHQENYFRIANNVFDLSEFKTEKEFIPEIEKIVDKLKGIATATEASKTPSKDYMACVPFVDIVKNYATSLSNNKAWMKIFAPLTIALVAITLLVQPLFGDIKKEFPDEGNNGGAK